MYGTEHDTVLQVQRTDIVTTRLGRKTVRFLASSRDKSDS